MKFLLRVAFWLTVVVLLLPAAPSQQAPAPTVHAGEAVSAAAAAMLDMRQFCKRQPDACVTGSNVFANLGQKAQAGAKALFELLAEHFGEAAHGGAKPSQNTLAPADVAAPWRGTPARKEVAPRRPA